MSSTGFCFGALGAKQVQVICNRVLAAVLINGCEVGFDVLGSGDNWYHPKTQHTVALETGIASTSKSQWYSLNCLSHKL
jgi:hypothetical protein